MNTERTDHQAAWLSTDYDPDLVSVIVPSYNRAGLIRETLDSVLAQTYRPLELIVVDDGSMDSTREVIEEWSLRSEKDQEFACRLLVQKNSGAPTARNLGARESRGEFILFLDSDDTLHPDKLELQVRALRKNLDWDFCYGPVAKLHTPDRLAYGVRNLTAFQATLRQLHSPFFTTMGPLVRREAQSRIGPWNESLRSGQDWELHTRMTMECRSFGHVPSALAYYRCDDGRENRVAVNMKKARDPREIERAVGSRLDYLTALWESTPADYKAHESFRRSYSLVLLTLVAKWSRHFSVTDREKDLALALQIGKTTYIGVLVRFLELLRSVAGAAQSLRLVRIVEWSYWRFRAVKSRISRLLPAL